MNDLHAVIMAGGSGHRFWPASRQSRPKQFLPLAHGKALLTAAVDRAIAVAGEERTWIVTDAEQAKRIHEVVENFSRERIIIEPEGRNTAPCVALATAWIDSLHPGSTLAFLPADHLIEPIESFQQMIERSLAIVEDDKTIAIFGIEPTRPSIQYGYAKCAELLDDLTPPAHHVERFIEKPDHETAEQLLDTGTALWNSGIFVATTIGLLSAMDAHAPKLADCTRKMRKSALEGDTEALAAAFREMPCSSIDTELVEKASRIIAIRADVLWEDLGSFLTLESVSPPDPDGNVVFLRSAAGTFLEDSRNCVIYGEGPRQTVLFGVDDLVIASIGEITMICPKDRAHEIDRLVTRLREEGHEDLL